MFSNAVWACFFGSSYLPDGVLWWMLLGGSLICEGILNGIRLTKLGWVQILVCLWVVFSDVRYRLSVTHVPLGGKQILVDLFFDGIMVKRIDFGGFVVVII